VKIKICGLTRREDVEAANVLLPDYIGFVFAESKRRVTPAQAAALKRLLRPEITTVGVFVNAPASDILHLAVTSTINAIQLHGTEDEAFVREVKRRTPLPIIKAVGIRQPGDAQAWDASAADFLLLDNPRGGSGQPFDWQAIGPLRKPFFLAGGLNPANVAQAIQATHPFAVDVSSGVETNGVKDTEKMCAFMLRAHSSG